MRGEKQRLARGSDTGLVFGGWLGASVVSYVGLIVLLVVADIWFVFSQIDGTKEVSDILGSPEIKSAVILTFVSCTVTAILSVFIAVPIAYALSRFRFLGRSLIDSILDIPVILPPLVIGLSLLILFNQFPALEGGGSLENWLNKWGVEVTNTKIAVVIAQFTVAAAFAVRAMKASFDQINARCEDVAMSLGASRGRAFFDVVLPRSAKGVLAAGTLAWARALGEFGPILVFAGATRGRTEVLSTSVFLEINTGNIKGAVVISLLMIALAMVTILVVRFVCERGASDDA